MSTSEHSAASSQKLHVHVAALGTLLVAALAIAVVYGLRLAWTAAFEQGGDTSSWTFQELSSRDDSKVFVLFDSSGPLDTGQGARVANVVVFVGQRERHAASLEIGPVGVGSPDGQAGPRGAWSSLVIGFTEGSVTRSEEAVFFPTSAPQFVAFRGRTARLSYPAVLTVTSEGELEAIGEGPGRQRLIEAIERRAVSRANLGLLDESVGALFEAVVLQAPMPLDWQ